MKACLVLFKSLATNHTHKCLMRLISLGFELHFFIFLTYNEHKYIKSCFGRKDELSCIKKQKQQSLLSWCCMPHKSPNDRDSEHYGFNGDIPPTAPNNCLMCSGEHMVEMDLRTNFLWSRNQCGANMNTKLLLSRFSLEFTRAHPGCHDRCGWAECFRNKTEWGQLVVTLYARLHSC